MKRTELGRAPDSRFITPKQLAKMLQVSSRSVYRWVQTNSIPYTKMGKAVRFDLDEVRAWSKARVKK